MPSGEIHTFINLSVCAGLWLLSEVTGFSLPNFSAEQAGAAFLFGTLLVTPDLDINGQNLARRNWGPLGFIWMPYARLCRHRGLSHSYLLGPLLRLLYILPVVLLAAELAGRIADLPAPDVLALLLGYLAAQALHSAADGIPLSHGWRCLTEKTSKRSRVS